MTLEKIYKEALKLSKIFRASANKVDLENAFPEENMRLLKEAEFMKIFIPKEYGGFGIDEIELFNISRILSSGCLSTAVIWSMHYQQVFVLTNYLKGKIRSKILTEIAEKNIYIGSVTTEIGKGGTLLECNAALEYEGESIILNRKAPIVTGGDKCDAYLITMRRNENVSTKDVVLVYALKEDLEVDLIAQPNMLGMRGTFSSSINLSGKLSQNALINPSIDFNEVAIKRMIPVGHLAWAICWIGYVESGYIHVKNDIFRNPKINKKLLNETNLVALAKVRMKIDMISAYFDKVSSLYSTNKDDFGFLTSSSFQIKINSIKISSSEILYECVNDLIDIVGLSHGYIISDKTPLQRMLRDMRSSSLMFHNNRLLAINGKLGLFEIIQTLHNGE